MYNHIENNIRNIVCYMERMKTEELSLKIGNQEVTVLLTDCGENDIMEPEGEKAHLCGQECATSIPPEEGAQAGDSIIPALLNILPYDTSVEWKAKTGEWHANMIHEMRGQMIDSFPDKLRITYLPDESLLMIGEG